jgi:hypothetical protein
VLRRTIAPTSWLLEVVLPPKSREVEVVAAYEQLATAGEGRVGVEDTLAIAAWFRVSYVGGRTVVMVPFRAIRRTRSLRVSAM